jgi:hypothetical protein
MEFSRCSNSHTAQGGNEAAGCAGGCFLPGWLGASLLPPVVDLNEVGPLRATGQVDAGQSTASPVKRVSALQLDCYL